MSDTAGTCWDCTGVMTDVDGNERRTLYLHFFDRGQPTLNWIDASFGAWRIVIAQITYLIYVLGVTAVRLDANAFLGLEGTDAAQRPLGRGASAVGERDEYDGVAVSPSRRLHVSGTQRGLRAHTGLLPVGARPGVRFHDQAGG